MHAESDIRRRSYIGRFRGFLTGRLRSGDRRQLWSFRNSDKMVGAAHYALRNHSTCRKVGHITLLRILIRELIEDPPIWRALFPRLYLRLDGAWQCRRLSLNDRTRCGCRDFFRRAPTSSTSWFLYCHALYYRVNRSTPWLIRSRICLVHLHRFPPRVQGYHRV